MEKVDYNIEFAHVYINEEFSREHREAAWLANRVVQGLEKQGKTYSKVILIDDYNPSENMLNEQDFIAQLARNQAEPEFIAYEASLISLKEKVLEQLNMKRRKKSIRKYIEQHSRLPCSFLIVIWHLLRLGLITNGVEYYRSLNEEIKKPFVGKKLVTILPERLKSVEEKAWEVIDSSLFAGALDNSEFIFF
ncbi:hypothetical protein KJ596_01405 [Patescibacteria group bacterium]|nr:hypothetical protein [Patescibacteria group bacterium]MBU1868089.1 hypothetical protein [Patescibacteria group bacterium]